DVWVGGCRGRRARRRGRGRRRRPPARRRARAAHDLRRRPCRAAAAGRARGHRRRTARSTRRPARKARRLARVIGFALRALLFVGALALAAFLPTWLSTFRMYEFAYVGIYFIAILGLNILTGYTGQISLGQGAFMALGGYTTAILMADHGVKDVWTLPLAGLAAGVA